jgi:hypothetical protein
MRIVLASKKQLFMLCHTLYIFPVKSQVLLATTFRPFLESQFCPCILANLPKIGKIDNTDYL